MRRLAKALISGKYQQVQSRLRTAEGFCCLGVACDLMAKDAKKGGGRWDAGIFADPAGHRELFSLSVAVRKYYGLREGDYEIWLEKPGHGDKRSAMMLNDAGISFKAIGKEIMEYFRL
jgi:hypothetical protein